jgi:hypothetical protein
MRKCEPGIELVEPESWSSSMESEAQARLRVLLI